MYNSYFKKIEGEKPAETIARLDLCQRGNYHAFGKDTLTLTADHTRGLFECESVRSYDAEFRIEDGEIVIISRTPMGEDSIIHSEATTRWLISGLMKKFSKSILC